MPIILSGVTPYSKVGIISNNRHEWATIAAATYSLNATLVPMYEGKSVHQFALLVKQIIDLITLLINTASTSAQLPKDWTHILNDSQCQTLFASTEDIYLKIKKEVLPSTPLLNEVICLDGPKHEPNSFQGLMDMDRENCSVVEPTEDDLVNLIYTSGTTGKPKVSIEPTCKYNNYI